MKKVLSLITMTMLLLNQVVATVVPIIDEVVDTPSTDNDVVDNRDIYINNEEIDASDEEATDEEEASNEETTDEEETVEEETVEEEISDDEEAIDEEETVDEEEASDDEEEISDNTDSETKPDAEIPPEPLIATQWLWTAITGENKIFSLSTSGNIEIDCGNGSGNENIEAFSGEYECFYAISGEYEVKISHPNFLNQLHLSGQQIKAFTGGSAYNLTHLNLAKNALSDLSPDTFTAYTGLQYLDLSYNQLKELTS
jgi:hypothetical protein